MTLFRLLFIVLPLLEIAGFIIVGHYLGVMATLLLVVAFTVLGLSLLRNQGWKELQMRLNQTRARETQEQDAILGMLSLFGGLLLVLPGFITDAVGLLLLLLPVRMAILRRLIKSGVFRPYDMKESTSPHTIEGECWEDKKKDNDQLK